MPTSLRPKAPVKSAVKTAAGAVDEIPVKPIAKAAAGMVEPKPQAMMSSHAPAPEPKTDLLSATPDQLANEIQPGGPDPQAAKIAQFEKRMDESGFKKKAGERYGTSKISDALYEISINNMLYQPQTLMLNAASNAFNAIAVAPLDVAFSAAVSVFNKPGDKIYLRESVADAYGLFNGVMQGMRFTAHKLKNALPGQSQSSAQIADKIGIPTNLFGTNKLELTNRTISSGNLGTDPESLTGRLLDSVGAVLNLPGTVLNATDEVSKIVQSARYRHRWAARKMAEGEFPDFESAWRHIQDNPEIDKKALEEAEHYTYMGRSMTPQFSWITDTAMEKLPFMRWVVPFKRSIANIAEGTFERSPLVVLLPALRNRLVDPDPIVRATAQSRLLTGITLTTAMGYMLQDNLRGQAPRDKVQRDLWESVSGPADSLVYADGSIRLDNMGVIGQLLKAVGRYNQWNINRREANMFIDEAEELTSDNFLEIVGQFAGPMIEVLYDSFWGKNIGEFFDVLSAAAEKDSLGPITAYMERIGVKAIPIAGAGIARQVAQGEYSRKYTKLGDALRAQLPGLSDRVRHSYSWDGAEMLNNRYRGPGVKFAANPYDPNDAVTRRLLELDVGITGVPDYFAATLKDLPTMSNIELPKIKLTDEEWDKYNRLHLTGVPELGIPSIRERVTDILMSPTTRILTKALQKKLVVGAITKYRRTLRNYMKMEPGLRQRILLAREGSAKRDVREMNYNRRNAQ